MNILYDLLLRPLELPFMQRALLAGILVGVVCAVMGSYIIVRRMALLGDAISHAVLPGVVVAHLLSINFFIGAVVTGVITALGIGFVTTRSKVKEDTAMGVIFTSAFAFGVLLLSTDFVRRQSRGLDLTHILFGNVLGVSNTDLIITAITGSVVLITIALLYKELLLHSFDPTIAAAIGLPVGLLHYLMMLLLSLTIVASLQTVGIILVVAMLVTPGATAYLLTHRLHHMMGLSALIGTLSAITGLYASYHFNVSSGSSIVLTAGLFFILALIFSPSQGLLSRWLRNRAASARTQREDLLKQIYTLGKHEPVTEAALTASTGNTSNLVGRVVGHLQNRGLVRRQGQDVQLTDAGQQQALQLVRAHRLWETYLSTAGNLPVDALHTAAEQLEHASPLAMSDRLAAELGNPRTDPHGDPIPDAQGQLEETPCIPLSEWPVARSAVIVHVEDEPEQVFAQLAAMRLLPGVRVTVAERDAERLIVRENGTQHVLSPLLAKQVAVREWPFETGEREQS